MKMKEAVSKCEYSGVVCSRFQLFRSVRVKLLLHRHLWLSLVFALRHLKSRARVPRALKRNRDSKVHNRVKTLGAKRAKERSSVGWPPMEVLSAEGTRPGRAAPDLHSLNKKPRQTTGFHDQSDKRHTLDRLTTL